MLTWLSTGHSEAVTQRLELAALHARCGRNEPWRRLAESDTLPLKAKIDDARDAVQAVVDDQSALERSRGLRTRMLRPFDGALLGPCIWAPGVERLRAELAVSQALEAASSSHLMCLRAVSARRYALGAICAVLGTPRPRVVWSACVGAADDLCALFEGNGGFDAAWTAAAEDLKERLETAVFIDDVQSGDDREDWPEASQVRDLHLDDRFQYEPLHFGAADEEIWGEGEAGGVSRAFPKYHPPPCLEDTKAVVIMPLIPLALVPWPRPSAGGDDL